MINAIVFDLIEKLQQAKSIDQVKLACATFQQVFEFDHYAYVTIKPTSLTNPDIFIIENYPSEWVKEYHDMDYIKIDPLIGYTSEYNKPSSWQDIIKLDTFNHKKSKTVLEEAKKYGLNDGLCFSYRSHSGDLAIFSLSLNLPAGENASILRKALMPGKYITTYIYETLIKLNFNQEQINAQRKEINLTKREKQCMLWACEGKTAWEISSILNISERTAIFHLSNSATKLNAANRQHAVAKAVMLGIIKPEPCF